MSDTHTQKTSLYDAHIAAGAKIVDFAGWQMPINYGSQLDEHHQVRRDAGMFDVSHMVVLDINDAGAKAFLQTLLANDIDKLQVTGKALYSAMLNPDGGVIDDLIVYYLADNAYRMVVNAANRNKDIAWISQQITAFDATLRERDDLSIIAVQGPNAREKALSTLSQNDAETVSQLKPFFAAMSGDTLFARTGYTGEDGFEIIIPNNEAPALWQQLLDAGVQPIGLGARDTLRLEAGMNLYGTDMDETTSPLISGMGWTVAWEPESRDFIGRDALEAEKAAGTTMKLVGLILNDKGVLRGGQPVICESGEGCITSGSFSPTLGKSIALARIPKDAKGHCEVEIRGKRLNASIVKIPFVRNGKILIES